MSKAKLAKRILGALGAELGFTPGAVREALNGLPERVGRHLAGAARKAAADAVQRAKEAPERPAQRGALSGFGWGGKGE